MTRSPSQPSKVVKPALSPQETAALFRQAAQHRVARRYEEAIGLYSHIETNNPQAHDAPYFLALIDLARGRPADARSRLERLSRRLPKGPKVWNALAYTLKDLGLWSDALGALERASALGVNLSNSDRQQILEVLGRADEAVADYKAMAALTETRLAGLMGLSRLRPSALSPDDRAFMAKAVSDTDDPASRITLQFALGALAEHDKDYEAAFDAFDAGNRLKRRMLTGELPTPEQPPIGPQIRALHPDQAAERHRAAIAFRKAVFTRECIAAYEGQGHHIAAPIFIVGMPRSGSTLLEQILSSHRRVHGLGETGALMETARGRYPFDLFAPNPPGHFRQMAEAYFKAMHARGWTSAARFIDKMLMNYMDIGLIHLMTPKAVILHSVRDPVDTCLACWRQNFETSQEFSYDLADAGREYVRYREMMDHWNAILPGRVVEVAHEALVADPETQIRSLITKACGLEWDPACLRFYETKRPVRTASVAQVRKPIFTTSIQRWRRYEQHLGPLFEALGPYAPENARTRPGT